MRTRQACYVSTALSLAMVVGTAALARAQAPPQDGAARQLPDGMRVSVRLMQRLSSETAKTGEPVTFEVLEDVVIDNHVVVRQGTPAIGVIIEAMPKRRMGRAGKLSYALTETKSVDRQTIRLRATQEKTGGSSVTSTAVATTAVAVFVPVAAPFVLLRKGKDLVVAEGTRIEAFIDGDHVLQPTAVQNASIPVLAAPATVDAKLTNADILSLHAAGFGDDVIIAKIDSSTHDFDLTATGLVALKTAGVTERVITAMLRARTP